MLKILEKNLIQETLKGYLKQCVGWVIDLKNKYWQDPFVRSEINVILLQVAFALSLFIIAAIFFNYIYQDVLKTVIGGVIKGISSGAVDDDYLGNALEVLRSNRFFLFAFITFVLTTAFTFLVAKTTLRPLKDALNAQKRFISDIAHELRTPMSVIKTNSEVFLMDSHLDYEVKEMIQSNIEELDRMTGIINNLLSLKSLVRPEKTKFENVDMGLIIDSAANKLGDLAEKKNLEIIIKKISPHVVWGNAVALEQIVINLLKNAINYTNRNGQITVRVGPDYFGSVLLHIEDTGIGITKTDLLHIFEPFYRAERSRNKERGASGLGLTIVSELVKMHSGKIIIRSAENKGTVVVVTLPYGKKNNDMDQIVEFSKLNEISVNFLQKNKE